jgi:hypothetical protein
MLKHRGHCAEIQREMRRHPVTDEAPYQRYLASAAWRRTRAAALIRAGNRCAVDASHVHDLEVIHNTRERLGVELDRDLVVLCASCRAALAAPAIPLIPPHLAPAVEAPDNVVRLRLAGSAAGSVPPPAVGQIGEGDGGGPRPPRRRRLF